MGGIFISYRREDSGPYAGRLRDALSRHFGAEQVFRDIDSINPGERFPRMIEQEVGSCDALLAVIGPTWLAVTDDAGRRRLDDPDDYVRLEIATALGRSDVLVIPVLVGATSMPAAADLPKPLAALAECNARAYHRRELGRPGGTPDGSAREGREAARGGTPTWCFPKRWSVAIARETHPGDRCASVSGPAICGADIVDQSAQNRVGPRQARRRARQ